MNNTAERIRDISKIIPRIKLRFELLKDGIMHPKYRNNSDDRTVMIPRIIAGFFINSTFIGL
jgi:hypothetical protein